MTDRLYRIKPLEWHGIDRAPFCDSPAGDRYDLIQYNALMPVWTFLFQNKKVGIYYSRDSAKAAAEQHYIAQMEKGLEVVE